MGLESRVKGGGWGIHEAHALSPFERWVEFMNWHLLRQSQEFDRACIQRATLPLSSRLYLRPGVQPVTECGTSNSTSLSKFGVP